MIHWLKSQKRKALVTVLCGCGVGVLALVALFLAQGRFCDPYMGAVGHPYWEFSDGKMQVVACGQRLPSNGVYQRTSGGWVLFMNHYGRKNTNHLEFHLRGVTIGSPPNQMFLPRCWHFWMNSRGPLWAPWDK